jgi:hypothetical protein
MKFIQFLSFYLNHRQFVAATKITRRNTMHKYTRSISRNPFSTREEIPSNPLLYYSREIPPPP